MFSHAFKEKPGGIFEVAVKAFKLKKEVRKMGHSVGVVIFSL